MNLTCEIVINIRFWDVIEPKYWRDVSLKKTYAAPSYLVSLVSKAEFNYFPKPKAWLISSHATTQTRNLLSPDRLIAWRIKDTSLVAPQLLNLLTTDFWPGKETGLKIQADGKSWTANTLYKRCQVTDFTGCTTLRWNTRIWLVIGRALLYVATYLRSHHLHMLSIA